MIYDHSVYVLKLRTPDHWYVGSTYRQWWRRRDEHLEGWGSVAKDWRNVKGGDYTWSKPIDMSNPNHTFWIPEEFGGQRRINY